MIRKVEDDYNTVAYLCSHIFENTKPVLYVCKEDGDWQLLCGGEHPMDEIPHVVGIGHILERDPSLESILTLQDNWQAERQQIGGEWTKTECPS